MVFRSGHCNRRIPVSSFDKKVSLERRPVSNGDDSEGPYISKLLSHGHRKFRIERMDYIKAKG